MLNEEEVEAPYIEPYETFTCGGDIDGIRLTASWTSKQQGVICDLDLNAFLYDERARFMERVDQINRRSKDESCFLSRSSNESDAKNRFEELKLDFRCISQSVSAILLFLDGGPRNFQYLQSVNLTGTRILPERSYGEFLPKEDTNAGGWNNDTQQPIWICKSYLEPSFVSSDKDKLDQCTQLIISSVPSLEKFKPRLFASIRDLSAALSSVTLPKLKKKFQKTEDGLPIGQFTEVLFKQLYETHPKIIEEAEAAYTIAMLQEMFHQIDYNSDGSCSWDEFTSFCVQTGLSALQNKRGVTDNGSTYSLDQYVIEYGEEVLQRDHILSAYRLVSLMRYIPENRKVLVISEDADNVLILDEKFRIHSQLFPTKLQVIGNIVKSKSESNNSEQTSSDNKKSRAQGHFSRSIIYDIVYLSGRDMYCFTSSDHSITVCKELSSMEGMKVNYLQYNRFYHTLLHLKLCWSQKHEILCSTASDRVIYGWNIDTAQIIFQISRHSDIITDFIAVDHLDVFITSSMDRRIVMWSATSRRVKGVLIGHKRGVRCISQYENTLLSAGFECDARTWDLINKDCVAILKGHRHPIVTAKLMCEKAQSDREHRAITIDESGEFRVWNIYVRERASDPIPVPTIQIFEMQNSEAPLNQFRFLALPYNPRSSTSYYSNLIACSTKLLHFLPEKNTKEFVPPTACVVNSSAASIVTAVGKSILIYDLSSGEFSNIFESVASSDIFAMCMDGERGKRMYVGTAKGELLLINTSSGAVISHVQYHTKEITAICQRKDLKNAVYTSSMDGSMRIFEENGGDLHLSNSVEYVFGEGIGVTALRAVPSLHVLIAVSAGKQWGLLNDNTLKKLMIVHEEDVVTAIEIIGASRDKFEEEMAAKLAALAPGHSASQLHHPHHPAAISGGNAIIRENLLTLAVALTQKIEVYALDTHDLKGVKVFELIHEDNFYITDMTFLRTPDLHCVNYASMKSTSTNGEGHQLIAATDDGRILVWDTDKMRTQSEHKFRTHFKLQPKGKGRRKAPHDGHGGGGSGAGHHAGAGAGGHQNNHHDLRANSMTSLDGVTFLTEGSDHHHDEFMKVQATSPPGTGSGLQKPKLSRQGTTKVTVWLEATSKEIFPLAIQPKDKAVKGKKPTAGGAGANVPILNHAMTTSSKCWSGHMDSIPNIVALQAHGCFVTVSHDGYHRIWNLDMECLGELQLPNVTEIMKNAARCKDPATQWRFILERIPVTKAHIDFANTLVRQLTQSRQEKFNESQRLMAASQEPRNRHSSVPYGFKGFRDFSADAEDAETAATTDQEKLRREMIDSLSEVPPISEDVPPVRLPTKEERELIKMTILSDNRLGAATASMSAVSLLGSPSGFGFGFGQPSFGVPLTTTTVSTASLLAAGAADTNNLEMSQTLPSLGYGESKSAKQLEKSLLAVGMGASTIPMSTVRSKPAAASTTNTVARPGTAKSTTKSGVITEAAPLSPVAVSKRLKQQQMSLQTEVAESTVKTSMSFSNESKVCVSYFGVPSLWVVPGEKDIFGHSTIKSKNVVPDITVAPAFSDSSIAAMLRDGDIDAEGHRILRKINLNTDRVEVYDRSQPILLIRNPAMSTSIQLPALESLRKTEIPFGVQKDMYKNAEKFVNEKAKVNKQAIRNAVSVSRIEQNVRKVQTMTYLIQPPSHDEVILPKAQSSVLERHIDGDDHMHHHDDNRMRIRLMKSAAMVPQEATMNARPLDPDAIQDWVKRVKDANDNQDVSFYARQTIGSRKKKKREVISQAQVLAIEQKLSAAIRSEFRIFQQQNKAANGGMSNSSSMMEMNTPTANENRGNSAGSGTGNGAGGSAQPRRPSMISPAFADDDEREDEDDEDHDDGKAAISAIATAHATDTKAAVIVPTSPTKQEKFILTTRHLLPYYKLEAVHQFMDIFAKVDENFSGDLDVNEWIKLFSSLNESVTEQEARMIFMKIDKDSNGFLTMRELIPVVFNKATKEQQRMIIQYTEMELTKKMDLDHTPKVTSTDLEFLFEAYDTENVGFVEIALIRERIRSLRLPEQVLFYFMELITDLADDEMVNLIEFKRLFKPFTSTQKRRTH